MNPQCSDSRHRPQRFSLFPFSEYKTQVRRRDLEGLSDLITSYTETFPNHAPEFLVLSLGRYPMLGYMTFITGNLIKEASLSLSFTETWLRPP